MVHRHHPSGSLSRREPDVMQPECHLAWLTFPTRLHRHSNPCSHTRPVSSSGSGAGSVSVVPAARGIVANTSMQKNAQYFSFYTIHVFPQDIAKLQENGEELCKTEIPP